MPGTNPPPWIKFQRFADRVFIQCIISEIFDDSVVVISRWIWVGMTQKLCNLKPNLSFAPCKVRTIILRPKLHSKVRILLFVLEVIWYATPGMKSLFFRIPHILHSPVFCLCFPPKIRCLAPLFWHHFPPPGQTVPASFLGRHFSLSICYLLFVICYLL